MRIVLIDDDAEFLRILGDFFLVQGEHEVVGQASSGRDGLDLLARVPCDVALVGFGLPVMDGFDVIRRVRLMHGDVRTVMLSSYGQQEYVRRAEAAGADGLIVKDRVEEDLIPFLRTLATQHVAP